MRKPHAKHGKKRHRGTYPGDATVILHRAGITTREVEDQTRTWDCIGQVCSVFRRLSDANHFMLRRPILPVDPLDGMSRAVRAHCFADRREEGLFAEAREEPEALRVLSAGVHDFRGRMLIRSSPSATDPCPSEQFRSTHPLRTKLPESVWQSAAELARCHGIYVVARSLRLDYCTLKKHVAGSPETSSRRRKKPEPKFVEKARSCPRMKRGQPRDHP